jgi:diacylglycerol kinase family enzyme
MFTEVILLINPSSGGFRERVIRKLTNYLKQMTGGVREYRLGEGKMVADILTIIDPRQTPFLLLAAGDGTINSVINVLAERDDADKFRLVLIPIGTANIMAKELGINSLQKSLQALANGYIRRVHLGKVTVLAGTPKRCRYFISMASAGFDAMTVNRVNKKLKYKIGGWAYIYEFIRICFHRNFYQLHTTIDQERYRNILTCVSNGRYYGVKLPITGANISCNTFDVILLKRINLFATFKYLLTKKNNEDIVHLVGKNSILLEAFSDNQPVQVDGDYFCDLPVKIEATNQYLYMYQYV